MLEVWAWLRHYSLKKRHRKHELPPPDPSPLPRRSLAYGFCWSSPPGYLEGELRETGSWKESMKVPFIILPPKGECLVILCEVGRERTQRWPFILFCFTQGRTHIKRTKLDAAPWLGACWWKPVDTWGSLASWPKQMDEFMAQQETLSQNIWRAVIKTSELNLWPPHVCAHMWDCTHTHTPTKICR